MWRERGGEGTGGGGKPLRQCRGAQGQWSVCLRERLRNGRGAAGKLTPNW